MDIKSIGFSGSNTSGFYKTLRKRVDDYFKTNNISRHANSAMVFKTIFMLVLYFTPYFFVVGGYVTDVIAYLTLWLIMGIGMAGIGLSIMHDANHSSYSRNQAVNNYLGKLINLVGGHATNWKIQHNMLHHTYTNVDGMDEDIDAGILLRFSPNQKRYGIHRFQHIYAWLLYTLMTLSWFTIKDFRSLIKYRNEGLVETQRTTFGKELASLIAFRSVYIGYTLVIPMLTTSLSIWYVVLGFLLMHLTAGFVLSCIFQPAHVMETSEFNQPDGEGMLENDWAVHQVLTTADFAPNSKVFSWFVGGLNYQIEHHLFPNICHIHYRKLSPIVRQTAQEFGLPYHVYPTFIGALWEHGKMLRHLGRV